MKNLTVIISLTVMVALLFSCTPKSEQKDEQSGQKEEKATISEQQPNTLSQQEIDEGWVLLFDGETTKGWRGYNKETFPEKGWVVEDGTLQVLSSGKGEAGGGGDIITEKKYGNFELSLEWKVSEGGNSRYGNPPLKCRYLTMPNILMQNLVLTATGLPGHYTTLFPENLKL